MALQLSALHLPSIEQSEVAGVIAYEKTLGGGFGYFTESFRYPQLLGSDDRRDFPHFWFYSALAAPWVALARATGMHPVVGFVLANTMLFLVALAVSAPRAGWAGSLLLFLGPIVWWIDKVHTEVFTFSLLALGIALAADGPWWSMVAFGAAATQNMPLAIAIPLVAVVAAVARPDRLRDRRFWLGTGAGLGLVALHPLYYLARLGVPEPQLLVGGVGSHVPRVTEMGAFVWDPNIGILTNFPALAPVFFASVLTAAVHRGWRALGPDEIVAVVLGLLLLVVFAQTPNVNSGGTPGPARYGLWLIPLAIPFVAAAERHGGRTWRRGIAAVALASCVWSLVTYHPRRPESYLEPTMLAAYLWEHHPALDRPLPEVFAERVTAMELLTPMLPPAATASCSKVLLVEGTWPTHCKPVAVPGSCAVPGEYCYANRRSDGTYGFSWGR